MQAAVYLGYAVAFSLFTWLVVAVKNRRRLVAVTVTTVLVLTFVSPKPAQAQGNLIAAIQAVLNVINGVIQTALNGINTVRMAISNFYQSVIWPVQLINQARAQVLQMVNQYRILMASILNINLRSATLPNAQALENLIRDHRVNNFGVLTQAFGSAYGAIPTSTDASPTDRAMSDMEDSLALDSLKTLKASDEASDLELMAADSIENSASQAAPGSAPFLTATATASSIRSEALTQRIVAAELRQEAAKMAHENELRKHGATFTTQLRGAIINLLQHN
jgi:hypothetical protein